MRMLAALTPGSAALAAEQSLARIRLHGLEAAVALVEQPDADFDAGDAAHAESVLVEVAAFSCNYRERARILKVASAGARLGFIALGSEFAGTVIKVGPGVHRVKLGDRVCGDGSVEPGIGGHPGLSTQKASARLQVHHQDKLCRLPQGLPLATAAAFSVGAQTAYSMVNRLRVPATAHVAVTAAMSNTSLFALKALIARGHDRRCLHALTTSPAVVAHLAAMGIERVCLLPRDAGYAAALRDYLLARRISGFDAVIDPFMDIYLRKLLPHLQRYGQYMSCGIAEQHDQTQADSFLHLGLGIGEVFSLILRKSVSLVGNNLGTSADLAAALDDFAAGRLTVDLAGVIEDGDVQRFVDLSFGSGGGIGKVVFVHPPAGPQAAERLRPTGAARDPGASADRSIPEPA